ncbi:MAG TPA: PAS domain S-box protein [Myxococcota bacterium]|nr:PAS domain S-box protein [Myxococcota bacterium]
MALAECMARAPGSVLDRLAEIVLELCRADSAGISIAELREGQSVFCWRAVAGRYAPLLGSVVPYDLSPCAVVVERKEPTLFREPARLFPVLQGVEPPIREALLVPFFIGGELRGALWAVAHDSHRFDSEDVRLLRSLAHFASLALQTLSLRGVESALSALERRFEEFMEHLPGLAWIKDLAGRYVFVNDGAERAFGRPRAQILGRSDAELFPAPIAEQFQSHDRAALADGKGIETIETLEHGDGVHHSLVAKFPIPGADDAPAFVGGVAIDITSRLQAQQVLRESEERLRAMADHSPAIIYMTHPDGECIFLSAAWRVLTGREVALGLGFGWAEAIHPDDLARVRRVFEPTLDPKPFRIEFRLVHAAGGHHWMIGSGAPRFGDDGEFLGWVGSVLDVDKEKRAEEGLRHSIRLYRAVGDSIDYGIWICDPTGRNVYASESFLRLVGLTQEQCSDYGWAEALHPDDVERTRAFWAECVRSGKEWDFEHRFRGVDGQYHPVLSRGVPVKGEHGETIAWAGINLDITRLKQVETELREVDRRKDEFLATLAHELRNPLAPIRNSLHVLKLAGNGPQSERVHEVLDRQVNHLIRLVDDLLEVARITSGKIELRRARIELAEVVRAAVETSRPAIERARHHLDLSLPSEPLWLDADSVRLAQVLSNLLNNAAKYTEEGGRIWLRAERRGRFAVLSVRDTGVGIPPAMQPRVFDLFTQVDRTLGRAQGGLGIGLALVKRLVEMHGGSVAVESAGWGAGSEFTVRLPLLVGDAESAAETTPPPAIARASSRRRFLVVDDNQDAADSLAVLLRLQGIDAEVAYDGPSALELMKRKRPEVVVLDLGMPGMDGYEVAAEIRADAELRDTVLVALTGWGQPDHRQKTAESGFDRHLVKPVELSELQALVTLRTR